MIKKYLSLIIVFIFITINAEAKMTTIGKGLVVNPHRIVLTNDRRSKVITVRNDSKKIIIVKITQTNETTDNDGKYIITKDKENYLGRNLRFSPRKVSIAPGEQQKVRVMIRNPRKFQDHEYACRIHLTAVQDKKKKEFKANKKLTKNAFNFIVSIGYSISVMYRPDNIGISSIESKNLKKDFKNNKLYIEYDDTRVGNTSVVYNQTITWINPDGSKKIISKTNEMTVYHPASFIKRKETIGDINGLDPNGHYEILNKLTK